MRKASTATSYHEAGHAVAAYILRVPFASVTIMPEVGAAGYVLFLRQGKSLQHTHSRGIIGLAGEVAQRRYNPRSIRSYHGSSDRQQVLSFAFDICGSQKVANAIIELWKAQAEDLIESKWVLVEALVTALQTRHTLTAVDVQRVVRGAILAHQQRN